MQSFYAFEFNTIEKDVTNSFLLPMNIYFKQM